jgi:hypothetical protein
LNTSLLNSDDEGGGFRVCFTVAAGELRIVVSHEQADQGQCDNVEESDSPEDLFQCRGQRLSRVGSFSCSETDKFSSGKCKGSSDEDIAESFESVVKGAWVLPVLSADVTTLGSATTVENYSQQTSGIN